MTEAAIACCGVGWVLVLALALGFVSLDRERKKDRPAPPSAIKPSY